MNKLNSQINICFKCKGKGSVTKIDWFIGVCTMGLTALMDASNKIKCNSCNGKGYLQYAKFKII